MKNLLLALAAVAPLWAQADRAAPRTDPNSQLAHQQLLAKTKGGPHRCLFRRRLHHAAVGSDRLSAVAGKLEEEFLRLERRRFWLGRGPRPECPLAPGERRVGWRQPESDRAACRHEQRGQQGACEWNRRGCGRCDQGPCRSGAGNAVEGPRRNDHPDGNFPAQRQHGRDAGNQCASMPTWRRWRMAGRSAIWTSTANWRTRDGKLHEGMMNADKLHPAIAGYQVWADALKPILTELLGPPAKEDYAPAPTGDPSARR